MRLPSKWDGRVYSAKYIACYSSRGLHMQLSWALAIHSLVYQSDLAAMSLFAGDGSDGAVVVGVVVYELITTIYVDKYINTQAAGFHIIFLPLWCQRWSFASAVIVSLFVFLRCL